MRTDFGVADLGLNLSPPNQQAASPLDTYSLICKVGVCTGATSQEDMVVDELGHREPSAQGRVHTWASGIGPCCGFSWPRLTQPQRHLGIIRVLLGTSHPLCSGLHLVKPSALMPALA